jgi:hypothetical protein
MQRWNAHALAFAVIDDSRFCCVNVNGVLTHDREQGSTGAGYFSDGEKNSQ